MDKWIKKQMTPPLLFLNLNKQQCQAHGEAGENLPCHKSQAFGIAEMLNFSSIWSAVQWHYTNSKRKMLNYGCRSKHGNSIQSSHAIKCSAGCESQKKKIFRTEEIIPVGPVVKGL